eukprot:63668_1
MEPTSVLSAVLSTLQWVLSYSASILLTLLLIITDILVIYSLCKLYTYFKQNHRRNHKKNSPFNNIKTSNSTNTEETNNTIFVMMELIKKHSNYKIMQQNKPLTTRELIGLILYTYSRGYCNKMKQSRNDWYVDTSNAIEKIYSVLHYKNDQQQPKILFHGSANPSLDQFSQEELLLKTFCSFTTEFSIAKKFATGSILVITQVDERLRSGQLKGANVSWISPYDEYEWIILPTIFHSWREMSKQKIIDNGWAVANDIKVYVTDDYESNIGLAEEINAMGIIKIALNYIFYLIVESNLPSVEQMDEIMNDINQYKDDYGRRANRIICECEWIHHDTIPTKQFAPISTEDRQHIAEFHPDLHCRLNNP